MINDVKYAVLLFKIFIISLLYGIGGAQGTEKGKKENTIIQCLGKEEQMIHTHQYNGPLYSLNQKMLNTFIYNSDLQIKPGLIQKICQSKDFSPSVNLLRYMLLEGKDLFHIEEKDPIMKIQKNQVVEVLLLEVPNFFFQYLADIQSVLPTPHCLSENVPEISKLLVEFQYVEPESEWNPQLLGKKKLDKIFTVLTNLDQLIKRCQKKKKVAPKKTP